MCGCARFFEISSNIEVPFLALALPVVVGPYLSSISLSVLKKYGAHWSAALFRVKAVVVSFVVVADSGATGMILTIRCALEGLRLTVRCNIVRCLSPTFELLFSLIRCQDRPEPEPECQS